MKRRMLSIITALALCLSLLPGTALAAGDGVVTITDLLGKSVTLEPGKKYVAVYESGGGVAEAEDALADYLTYENGVLTVRGNLFIKGSMTVTADLAIQGADDGGNGLTLGDYDYSVSNPTGLTLGSHTLTLTENMDFRVFGFNLALDQGTIEGGTNLSFISGGAAASGPLTVRNAGKVQIEGKNDSGSILPKLTVERCANVSLVQANATDESIVMDPDNITADGPVRLQKFSNTGAITGLSLFAPTTPGQPGGTLYDPYDDIPADELKLYNCRIPTVYRDGESRVYYKPNKSGNPNVLTLENVTYTGTMATGVNAQVVLKGKNEVALLNATPVELTGDGDFTGKIVAQQFTNNSTGTVNAVVAVDSTRGPYTVYGERSTSDFGAPAAGSKNFPLTVTSGATLTVKEGEYLDIMDPQGLKNQGTVVNNGTIQFAPGSSGTASFGKIVNDGVFSIFLENGADTSGLPALIRSLGLTGGGHVAVTLGTNPGPSYTHGGALMLGSAGELDLSTADTTDEPAKGYSWNAATKTLTLQEGFNAAKVILPDDTVTIETQGESTIKELAISGSNPEKTQLTFTGAGPLTVQQQINIAGGDNNALTVAAGAHVIANEGIFIGASGGDNSTVTVNGFLEAKGNTGTALSCGKIVVGGGGTLKVSGDIGLSPNGMSQDASDKFTGALTVQPNGTFMADCKEFNIRVETTAEGTFTEENKNAVLNVPSGYLPSDCKVEVDEKGTAVFIRADGPFTIGKANIPAPPSGGGSSGGSSDRDDTYTVTVEDAAHGAVSSNRTRASSGSTVTLTVKADNGYTLDTLTVTDSRGDAVALTERDGGRHTFTMPGRDVTVRAVFARSAAGYETCPRDSTCPIAPYTDASADAWYHDGVHYCLENGLMTGYGGGLFGPRDNISRAQLAQLLHNREGRPVVNYLMQFTDVSEGKWYTEAVRWAASQGVVEGYGDGRFGPGDPITREQLAVMLWRYAGKPAAGSQTLEFADAGKVSGYAQEALAWAVEQGILQGKDSQVLDPKGQATRAETAVMLMRFLQK